MALTTNIVNTECGARRRLGRVTIGVAGDYSSGITVDPAAFSPYPVMLRERKADLASDAALRVAKRQARRR